MRADRQRPCRCTVGREPLHAQEVVHRALVAEGDEQGGSDAVIIGRVVGGVALRFRVCGTSGCLRLRTEPGTGSRTPTLSSTEARRRNPSRILGVKLDMDHREGTPCPGTACAGGWLS